jgi:hypothetical protein
LHVTKWEHDVKRFMLLASGFEPPTSESVTAWGTCQGSVADRIVEHGGFPRGGREFSPAVARDLPLAADSLTGYCVIQAESLEEAAAIALRTPFVAGIRVYEIT